MNWDDYKKQVKAADPVARGYIEEMESLARQDSAETGQATRIYEARTNLGLSRGYVAKAVGISEEELQQIEEGSSKPSQSVLSRLSALFHLPGEYFIQDDAFEEDGDRKEIKNLHSFKKKMAAQGDQPK